MTCVYWFVIMNAVIEMRKNIGERIKKFRKAANLNQSELASLLGVTNRAVSNWESGNNGVDVDLIPSICVALNVSPNELLDTPSDNTVDPEVLDFARQFELLTPVGKELIVAAMTFALKHHKADL